MESKLIRVSIVIPTFNEEKNIVRLLKSIRDQSYKNIETIVVDDGSSDKTISLAKKYTKKVFARAHAERSVQRNFGALQANGKYLMFLDADMELSHDVVSQCVELISTRKKIGSITIPEVSIAKTFWEKVKKYEREFYNLSGDLEIESARFFPTKLFNQVGGYDENITGPEDWDLPESIYKLGYKSARIKAKIKHYERVSSLWSLAKKKYYYGLRSHVYLTKHKVNLVSAKTIYFLRPVFYKNWKKLVSKPILSFSMLVMLLIEQVAGALGFLKGKLFQENNILILSSHFSPNVGGVETHLDDLVKVLVRKNIKVSVLTYIPLTTNISTSLYEKKDSLEVFRIPWIRNLFYKLVNYPVLEFLYLLPGLFIALPFVILFKRPSVVQSHGLVAGFSGLVWGKIFGLRTIITTHSLYEFPNTGLYHHFARFIFKNSDKILVLSEQSKKEVEKLTDRTDVIKFKYWIDLNKFKPKSKSKEKFIVLFVGRLVEIKGVKLLINSAKSWNKNIHLHIIGTGPLENFVKNSLSRNIKYFGKIKNKELPRYYNEASLVIVPSINEEGFGRVILESLATGTPVIASNLGGVPEAMDNSVGRLIKPTEENIKKSVEYLFENKKKLNELQKNAVEYARVNYSEKNAEKIIQAFR